MSKRLYNIFHARNLLIEQLNKIEKDPTYSEENDILFNIAMDLADQIEDLNDQYERMNPHE